jgi:hypothetical protein
VEDAEAEFLLENISFWPKHTRSADMLKEMARILGNLERKRKFKLKAIITTEDERSFTRHSLGHWMYRLCHGQGLCRMREYSVKATPLP